MEVKLEPTNLPFSKDHNKGQQRHDNSGGHQPQDRYIGKAS